MGIKLHICFDLGSDTLKIVYAYKKEDQALINFGKIMFDELINQSAIPATAYFDEDQNKWLFADQVEDGKVRSFVNTVKIKTINNANEKFAEIPIEFLINNSNIV